MKTVILFLSMLSGLCAAKTYAASTDVLKEEEIVKNSLCIRTITDSVDVSALFGNLSVSIVQQNHTYHYMFVSCEKKGERDSLYARCMKSPVVKSVSPVFEYNEEKYAYINQVMVFAPRDMDSATFVNSIPRECSIISRDEFDSVFWIIGTNDKDGLSSLRVTRQLEKTGLYDKVFPDAILTVTGESNLVNDPMYSDQWNLYYATDTNVDINAESAWSITKGNANISVAMFDTGVELDHPDLMAGLIQGYDAPSNTYPAGGPSDLTEYNAHGTKCAGVIAAQHNNNIGLAGIAPDAKVMPIRMFVLESSTSSDFVSSINYAISHGASIVNMSWHTSDYSGVMQYAIQNAVLNGRNGKGCVFVTAAGVYLTDGMSYFPRYVDDVIVVGGTNKCGYPTGAYCPDGDSGGPCNTGDRLSVMAPAISIPTTKTNHQYHYGVATSISSAQVSGVAALILSANPQLTARQVRYVLESTAQRPGPYVYSTTGLHPNGPWCSDMGYGLVDAWAAVQKAQQLLSVNDLYIKDASDDTGFEPNNNSSSISSSPDIWITDLSGNPVTTLYYGETYQIKVRVRNISSNAFVGDNGSSLQVRWSTVTGDLHWNSDWTSTATRCGAPVSGEILNTLVSAIPAFGNVVYTATWTAPTYGNASCTPASTSWRLALVATVHDGGIIVEENATSCPIEDYVRQNNNVAMYSFTLEEPQSNVGPTPMKVSPNPNNGIFTVEYDIPSNTDGSVSVEIVNPMGVKIMTMSGLSGHIRESVNLQGMPAGIYRVLITNGDGVLDGKNIVLQ